MRRGAKLAGMGAVKVRQAARVLLIAPGPSVLLVGGREPRGTGSEEFWVVPGGGTSGSESPADTARRELWEEVGLHLEDLGALSWVRHIEFKFAGADYSQDEYFFVRRHEHFDPRPAQLTPDEQSWVTVPHWWALADIRDRCLQVHPPALVELALRWLDAGPGDHPVRID